MGEREHSDAYMDGWHAHRLEVAVCQNPHDETTMHYSNMEWCNGWCARFAAVKYGFYLDLDSVI